MEEWEESRMIILVFRLDNMFNVFQYDREVLLQSQEQKIRRSSSMLQQRRKKVDPILVKNYNNRVEKFLKTSMVNPIVHQEHIPPLQVVPRPSDPNKFKGGASIMIKGFKTEKQRIKEALENNKILDTNPIHSTFQYEAPKVQKYLLRKPAPSKTYDKFPVLKVESDESESSSETNKTGVCSQVIKIKKNTKKDGQKTHFKALMEKLVKEDPLKKFELNKRDSVFVNFPTGTLGPLVALIKNANNKIRFLSRPLSLQVLENCKVVVPKKINRFLRKGQGHLMVSSEQGNSGCLGKYF